MPTSASEYKTGKTKVITLPSFLSDGKTHPEFKIRKPNARAYARLLTVLDVGETAGLTKEQIKGLTAEKFSTYEGKIALLEALDSVIVNTVVEPKVVLESTGSPNEVLVDDIPIDDQMAIVEYVLDMVDLSDEKMKEMESFQQGTGSEVSRFSS